MTAIRRDPVLVQLIRRALAIARSMGASRIASDHLLLASYHGTEPVVPSILEAFDIRGADLVDFMELMEVEPDSATGPWPYTDEAIQALDCAEEEARRTGHDYIAPEHVLLGLLRAPGRAGNALRLLHVDASIVRGATYPHGDFEGRSDTPFYAALSRMEEGAGRREVPEIVACERETMPGAREGRAGDLRMAPDVEVHRALLALMFEDSWRLQQDDDLARRWVAPPCVEGVERCLEEVHKS